MEPYLITFRILHIVAALAWYGAAFLFVFFVEPTARALGSDAERFMSYLSKRRRIDGVIPIISAVTVIAGGFLSWHDSAGFDPDWITSDPGLGFTVGSVGAVIAFAMGFILIAPNVRRLAAIGAEIEASGGPPTEPQMARMAQVQRTLTVVGWYDFGFLTIAALAMSTARYLNF